MTNESLMKVKIIAECSPWSILQYISPALSDNWSCKTMFGLFGELPFYSGLTSKYTICIYPFQPETFMGGFMPDPCLVVSTLA